VANPAGSENQLSFGKTRAYFENRSSPGVHTSAIHGQLLASQVPFGYLFSGALILARVSCF
jgi:hypothetical protein